MMPKKTIIPTKSERDSFDVLVRFCPKCKSTDVVLETSAIQPFEELPAKFVCNSCRHSGYNFPELPLSKVASFKTTNED